MVRSFGEALMMILLALSFSSLGAESLADGKVDDLLRGTCEVFIPTHTALHIDSGPIGVEASTVEMKLESSLDDPDHPNYVLAEEFDEVFLFETSYDSLECPLAEIRFCKLGVKCAFSDAVVATSAELTLGTLSKREVEKACNDALTRRRSVGKIDWSVYSWLHCRIPILPLGSLEPPAGLDLRQEHTRFSAGTRQRVQQFHHDPRSEHPSRQVHKIFFRFHPGELPNRRSTCGLIEGLVIDFKCVLDDVLGMGVGEPGLTVAGAP